MTDSSKNWASLVHDGITTVLHMESNICWVNEWMKEWMKIQPCGLKGTFSQSAGEGSWRGGHKNNKLAFEEVFERKGRL